MTEPVQPLAGRGRRLAATLVDALLVPALALVLVMATGAVEDPEDYRNFAFLRTVLALAVLSYLILNGYLLWKRGQTLGKRLLSIAIVSHATGARAPLWRLVFVRALFFPLLYLIVSPTLALLPVIDQLAIFGKRRRCVHDYVAGTSVIRL